VHHHTPAFLSRRARWAEVEAVGILPSWTQTDDSTPGMKRPRPLAPRRPVRQCCSGARLRKSWANLGILCGTVLLPFPAAVLADAFRDGTRADEQTAAILYVVPAVWMSIATKHPPRQFTRSLAPVISQIRRRRRYLNMTAHRNHVDTMIRRYGRELTHREIAEAVRDGTPRLRVPSPPPAAPVLASGQTIARQMLADQGPLSLRRPARRPTSRGLLKVVRRRRRPNPSDVVAR
jgi:hypothetical protein